MQCRWARQRCQPDRFGDLREGDDVGQWAAPPHHEMNTASRILGTVDAVPCTAHNASSCGRGIAMTRIEVRTPNLKSISVGKLQAKYSVDGDRKSVVSGKSVSVSVDLGGRRIIKQKKRIHNTEDK